MLGSAWGNLGQAELARNRPAAAADCYRQMIRLRQDDNGALIGLGLALLRQGKEREAARVRSASRYGDPGFEKAHLLLKLLANKQGGAVEGAEPADKAGQSGP